MTQSLLILILCLAAIFALINILSKTNVNTNCDILDEMYKNNDISETIYKKYKYSKK